MVFSKIFSFSTTAAIMMVAAISIFSQATRPNFNRPSNFDVQHYTIRASFDPATKKVFGDTTVIFKPLKDAFSEITLDAVNFTFNSITLDPDGTKLKYRYTADKVTVIFDKAFSTGDTVSVRFKYTVSPKKGVYFIAENYPISFIAHSAQIWSQGEAEEARHWIPSFDFPSDKATTEEFITVNKEETVIGNGRLVEKIDEPNGKVTWHFKMDVPHSTYLISFVIGRYVKLEAKYGEIPLSYFVYPGREKTGNAAFGKTPDMMRVFESLTGVQFPYNKYDQTIVAGFQFGGMENITATTFADSDIFLADVGPNEVTDLVSHELAHSWFGDLVTCRNWAELWLNEGFASYMEAAYREKAFGRDDYLRKIESDKEEFMIDNAITRTRHGLYNLRAGNADRLFDTAAVTYKKGSVVIHMLRETVGDEAFWKGINLYLTRHKFGNVESTDLQKALEETSGMNLKWFFDQWVYKSGASALDVRPYYSAATKTLKLVINQTQAVDAVVPSAFRLPAEVAVITPSGTTVEKIEINKRVQTISLKADAKPTEIKFDPNMKIPLMRAKIRPLAMN